jgi:hypothetical protein
MELNANKSSNKFCCEICNYFTPRLSQYERHLATNKHKIRAEPNKFKLEPKKIKVPKEYACGCGKVYTLGSSLFNHKKKCDGVPLQPIQTVPLEITKDVKDEKIDKLTEQVGILTTALTTALTEGKLGNNTTNSNNTTNNQFNLNIYLNEKCKDAMNITDFVDQIKLQLSDLETQGSMGYVEGISNIFIKNLDEMDEDKRPIHCADAKREILYVKNNDTWEKGETGRDQMKKAIDTISKNNIKQFGKWINENPQCKVAHTPKADQFHQISSEVSGSTQEKNIDKVIRKIAKGTTIDKNNA